MKISAQEFVSPTPGCQDSLVLEVFRGNAAAKAGMLAPHFNPLTAPQPLNLYQKVVRQASSNPQIAFMMLSKVGLFCSSFSIAVYFGSGTFRRWTFRRRTFRCRDYSAPELFFLDSLFCSYVVSVCSSLRSR